MKGQSTQHPLFISFEGIDGCGKSTLMAQLIRRLETEGIEHVTTREPGGTPIGENIRNLLLDPAHSRMNRRAEVLLYTASRSQLVQDVILPALHAGKWVLSDRFIDATLAYQGYGRGLDLDFLFNLQEWATGNLWPHLTILLDCDVSVAWHRRNSRSGHGDRMEQEDRAFHERVRQGYLDLARKNPSRFLILNAGRSAEEVFRDFEKAFRSNDPARGLSLEERF